MGPVGGGKIRCDIGFYVAPGWRLADWQKIEHEFGDGVGRIGL